MVEVIMPTYEVRIKVVHYYNIDVVASDEELAAEIAVDNFSAMTSENHQYCLEDTPDIDVTTVAKLERYELPYDEDARHERMLNN
jgi:hypothetical protein